ncbi:hypothetical protein [Pseudomonas arsenicoxydans]|uniref:Uncharacterized protein n=1 Tax=Pseudomonas arsenicoxydans TaxID=702115 RepID=A0A4P6G3J8_9PSED|nr:hypothetical protein [Pseudomonas arsenicoxydans]QAY86025.1 hypothetical protein CUN61_19445 [Pseudomonas arsenicoxydans]
MNKVWFVSLCAVLAVTCSQAWAETVVPMKEQDSQQTQLDIDDCHDVEASQNASPSPSGSDPSQTLGRQKNEFYEGDENEAKMAYVNCLQARGYQVNP